jgi:hypothetical protein
MLICIQAPLYFGEDFDFALWIAVVFSGDD